MRKMSLSWQLFCVFAAGCVAIFWAAGCGGSSGSSSTTTGGGAAANQSITDSTLMGSVLDKSSGNAPAVSGVTVTAAKASAPTTVVESATTDSLGRYAFYNLPVNEELVISVSPQGVKQDQWGNTYRLFPSANRITLKATETARLDFTLSAAYGKTFDPTAAVTLNTNGSVTTADAAGEVELTANSLEDADGNAATGQVMSFIQPIDVTQATTNGGNAGIDAFPGTMQAIRTDQSESSIVSYGAMSVEFTDSQGNALNIKTGSTATIRIPVPTASQATAPATIPLWYFDTSTSLWKEEGTATLSGDKSYYSGTVSHFSTWNADVPEEVATVTGTVVYSDGTTPASYALVKLTGVGYGFTYQAITDASGNFSLRARRGYSANLEAVLPNRRESLGSKAIADSATVSLGNLTLSFAKPETGQTSVQMTITIDADTDQTGLLLALGSISSMYQMVQASDLVFYNNKTAETLHIGGPMSFHHDTPGGGTTTTVHGIQLVSGATFDSLTEAPSSGYVLPEYDYSNDTYSNRYDVSSVTSGTAVYATLNEAGYYGKVTVVSTSRDAQTGDWTVTFKLDFNPDGGRTF